MHVISLCNLCQCELLMYGILVSKENWVIWWSIPFSHFFFNIKTYMFIWFNNYGSSFSRLDD